MADATRQESWRRGNLESRLLCSEPSLGAKVSLLCSQIQMATRQSRIGGSREAETGLKGGSGYSLSL